MLSLILWNSNPFWGGLFNEKVPCELSKENRDGHGIGAMQNFQLFFISPIPSCGWGFILYCKPIGLVVTGVCGTLSASKVKHR